MLACLNIDEINVISVTRCHLFYSHYEFDQIMSLSS